VKRWKAILGLLCLAVWLPATQHCQLEKLPGLGFLQCPTDTPGNSDCQGDSCDVVEHGAYKTPDDGDIVLVPLVEAVLCEIAEILPDVAPVPNAAALSTDVPVPVRPDSWEYYSSRALAIRGPSLLS
jgi:hypothetical protein